MVSITNIGSGQAEHYYQKDNYYTKQEGQWQGKGAEALGLKGEIRKEDFQSLVHGKDPNGSFNIQNGGEGHEHRVGVDLTFSAPKSVSIISEVLGDAKVREAHNKAVSATLDYIEKNYSQARQTQDGKTERVDTGNLVIAKFEHNTSRELDPQLHTHAVIMNVTQREDGQWRALSNEQLFENKMLIGQYYRNELAANLRELGYAIQTDSKGFFEIRGVDEKLINEYSRRSEQIQQKVNELREQFPYVSESKLREMACLDSRVAKKDVDMHIVRENWEDRLSKQGYSLQSLKQSIEKAAEQAKIEERNKTDFRQSEYDYIRSAANIKHETESTFSKEDVLKIAGKLSVGEHRISDLENAYNDLAKDREIKQLDKNVYTTAEMQKIEHEIVQKVRTGHNSVDAITTKEQVQQNIKSFEQSRGFTMTQGQKDAVEHILTSKDRFIGIQGDAGTGKTTMLANVREQLENAGYGVRGLGFTGKAALEVEQQAGIKSQTIDSFLLQFSKQNILSEDQYKQMREEYDKALSHFSKKDIDAVLNREGKSTNEVVTKALLGLKTKFETHDNTLKLKQESFSSQFRNFIKNETINKLSFLKKNEHTYDVIYKDKNTNQEHYAKQHVSVVRDRVGFSHVVSHTLLQNGNIVKFESNKNRVFVKDTKDVQILHNPKNSIIKNKEVWVVDEASMLGSIKMHALINAAEKAGARIVLIGDTKQLQSVEAGKMFGKLQETGDLKTVRISEVQRQKEEGYKDIVKNISEKKIDRAFDKLEKQDRIREISDRQKRLNTIVKDYTSRDYRNTIIVTARNADRNELNQSIRSELKNQGKIDRAEHIFSVRESKNLSAEKKHFAQSYSEGDRIIANKAGIIGRAGTEAKVTAVDQSNHSITVETSKGEQHTIDLKTQGQHLAVYSEKEQSFSRGDKIVFLKNDKSLDVKNGQIGEIKNIDENGKASIKMENGQEKNINLKSQYNYVGHGYAVTDYKSQGQTAQNVLYHADTSKGVNYNQAYVAMTRGKQDVQIYTDSKENFKEQIKHEQVKTSTLDYEKQKNENEKTEQAHKKQNELSM